MGEAMEAETPATEEIQAPVETKEALEKRKREEENPWRKTSLCSYFRRAAGSCSHGDACRYAHGEEELRPRPDNSWDPTSERAKKLLKTEAGEDEEEEDKDVDFATMEKCLVGLPRKWTSDSLKSFLDGNGIVCVSSKKKKGMTVGFVRFADPEQIRTAIEILKEKTSGGKQIKVADAIRRFQGKKPGKEYPLGQTDEQLCQTQSIIDDSTSSMPSSVVDDDAGENDGSTHNNSLPAEGLISKARSVCDVVTPLAYMPYNEQLEHKKNSLLQTLKRLTRNARKACPDSISLPEWILKSRDIGGLPCKLEGIIESPLINGYRNKCEFSVGYSSQGKRTVGFMLGNFREGITAVEEPINCPNVSEISCKFALIFQEFLESSVLPVWNRIENHGFWRQFTVREGRSPSQVAVADSLDNQIAEVMLIIQVCSSDVDEKIMQSEFKRMVQVLVRGAATSSPTLPLTTVVVQDHKGISNVAPADCPMFVLPLAEVEEHSCLEKVHATEARINDYINNLRFCLSPTAFFQVNTLAAEKLYSLAGDWADLNSDTLLFDVCCGTGTIGLTLAHRVGMVVGIEMNSSAVSDANRNAEINGITNCRFVCGKAEDVIGPLLKEYLDELQPHGTSSDLSTTNGMVGGKGDGNKEENDTTTTVTDITTSDTGPENDCPKDKDTEQIQEILKDNSNDNNISSFSESSSGFEEKVQEKVDFDKKKVTDGALRPQFKNIVAIVDPPRVGLHPIVIKTIRTHHRLRRLVYISCNPESLVANAIELCTPTADKPEKSKGNKRWRSMSNAGLARQRAKSMPNSEPFRPVRAVAVDLFPHTQHCEMVMLLER
ncbi:(Uracil-5)-methyltransferase family protein [Dioscorea alata]|uniref:(Uracil-5)-methyltransferase family protein n=1 Tax=Dioscorea alata TaxID=55571 RepID=A0ACB7UPN6_DIOAL|nr:(Uracil-5)-methyltransferase family protein [Dioscorea alata]